MKAFYSLRHAFAIAGKVFFTLLNVMVLSLMLSKAQLPAIYTNNASNRTITSAELNANITSTGATSVIERGFFYKVFDGYPVDTLTAQKIYETGNWSVSGAFSLMATTLDTATHYSFIAFAKNSLGTVLGSTNDFFTLEIEPNGYPASFTASTISLSQITLAFSAANTVGNASGYLIAQSQGSPSAFVPSDGQSYTPGTTNGQLTIVSMIYNTGTTTTSVTNLTSGTTYYYKIFPFNWNGTQEQTINYRTVATPPTAVSKTILPPTITTSSTIENIRNDSAKVSGAITNTGGENATVKGICYKVFSAGDPTISNDTFGQTGSFGIENFSITLSGLSAQTRYKARAFARNSTGVGYGQSVDFYTFSVEPSNYPAVFTTLSASNTQVLLKFSPASTITNCDGYIIIQGQGSIPTGIPTDGINHSVGTGIGNGTIAAIINSTSDTSVYISAVNAGYSYFYKIYPFNWDLSNSVTLNYKTSGTAPGTSALTVVPPALTTSSLNEYTSNSAIIYGNITNTGAQNLSARGICYKVYASGEPLITDLKNEEAGTFGTGSFSRTLISLSPETRYKARAYAINASGVGYGNTIDFFSYSLEPLSHAAVFNASAISLTQIQLSFSQASTITNADGYLIIQKQGSAPTAFTPEDGKEYYIGYTLSNETVVAIINSTNATSVNISNLMSGNVYYYKLIPYNWDGTNSQTYNYLTASTIPQSNAVTIVSPVVSASANPASITVNTATIDASVTDAGGAIVNQRGVCYKVYATGDPDTNNFKSSEYGSFSTGSYSRLLSSLSAETRYKYRAFAVNNAGIGYGLTFDFFTLSAEPSSHAASFLATTSSTTQIDLSFSPASSITNADGYLILQRQGAIPTGYPEDGKAYSPGNSIGNGSVCAIINSKTITTANITSVSAGNTYYFLLIPYNSDSLNAETYNYYTGGTIPTASASTIIIPSVTTSQVLTGISNNSAGAGGAITNSGGASATLRGICYKVFASGDPDTSNFKSFDNGFFGPGSFTRTLTGLSPETQYKYRAYAKNSAGVGYGNTYSFFTLSNEPTAHALTFLANTVSTTQIDLSFSPASSITNADGYLIIQRQGASPTSIPSDGIAYNTGSPLGNGIIAAIIINPSQTSASITSVSAGNNYYFILIPYNWDGSNPETYNYYTGGSIPGANATTVIIPTITTSSTISGVAHNTAVLEGNIISTGGALVSQRGICFKIFSTGDPSTSDSVRYESGSFSYGTYTRTLTGLLPETRYKGRAYAINSAGTGYGNSVDFYTLSYEPAAHSSLFNANTVSTTQIDLSFNAASSISNADGYIIVQRQGSAPTGLPSDATAYNIGAPIGNGVVAAIINNSSLTSVSITSVSAGNTYYFTLIPYNWDGSNYQTYNYYTGGTIPLAIAVTVVIPTVTTSTFASNVSTTGADLSGSIVNTGSANATYRGICYKQFSSGDPTTADLISQDTGSYGTGSFSRNISGLSPETRYKFRAYAVNTVGTGYGSTFDFHTISPEPQGHAAAFSAVASSTNQIDLSFDPANSITNADGYIILQRQGALPTGMPDDGVAYVVGNPIGNGFVAAIINNTSATFTSVTSVSAGNTYYFLLIPFNWNSMTPETYNYFTGGTIPNASATTVALPTVLTSPTITNITTVGASVTGSITGTGGSTVTTRGICYKTFSSGDPTVADLKTEENGSFSTGIFSRNLSSLTEQTRYKVRAFAENTAGIGYGQTFDFFTLSPEPLSHASVFTGNAYSTSQIDLSFSPASSITNADGYIIIQSQNVPLIGVPDDATAYIAGNAVGNGVVAFITYNTSRTTASITNLNAGIKYYFSIFPFNWDGSNSQTYNYRTLATVPEIAISTNKPCPIVAAIQASGSSIICKGDSLLLTTDTSSGLNYMWTFNGAILPKAKSAYLYAGESGEYRVFISNGYCSQASAPFNVTHFPELIPEISSSGQLRPCSNDSMELSTSFYSRYLWSTGDTNGSIWVKTSGEYTVTVVNVYGCRVTSNPVRINAASVPAPNICIVTVDTSANKNLIAWERPVSSMIDSYYIYKETTEAGKYKKIGSLAYEQLSVFIDQNSYPLNKADRYRISILDSCGIESPMSPVHKTMHLTANKGIGSEVNLIWSHYEGFQFSTYKIYRGEKHNKLVLIDSIQNNLNSYTDLNPPKKVLFYQVVVSSPTICSPGILRGVTTSGPFSQSLSNLKDYNADIANAYMTISPSRQRLYKDSGSTAVFNVYTNLSSFSASSDQGWLTISVDTVNFQVIAVATENKQPDERVATITIKGQGISDQFVEVIQNGVNTSVDEFSFKDKDIRIYPNPYSGKTNISYSLIKASHVVVEVYNLAGEKVEELINKKLPPGNYGYQYSAKENGNQAGVYILKITVDGKAFYRKLVEL